MYNMRSHFNELILAWSAYDELFECFWPIAGLTLEGLSNIWDSNSLKKPATLRLSFKNVLLSLKRI